MCADVVPATLEPMNTVDLEQVTRRYGSRTALDHVSLGIPAGSFVAVMGATGSGKSTLLQCAAGLDRPSSGTVRLAGRDITRLRERRLTRLRRDQVGFVFQSYNLLSDLTVRQNVLLPVRLGARPNRSVDDALRDVGLHDLGRQKVGELSGGQRQRVALARALITGPAVVFADEPTGALDPTTGGSVLRLLREACDTDGVTVVMVTHDPAAAASADQVLFLSDGRMVDRLDRPTTHAVAERLAKLEG
jgi:putative ABC transport system ATP-binding protein